MRAKCVRMLPWLVMTVLLAALLIYSLMSEALHEWMGLAWGAAALLHARQTAAILKAALQRPAPWRRRIEHLLALALLAAALAAAVTGLLMSRESLPFLRLRGFQAELIPVHAAAAHWLLVLMGLHIGLHWRGIAEALLPKRAAVLSWALCTGFAASAAAGIPAAVRRGLTESLAAASDYLNLDPARPLVLHAIESLFMLCLFAALGALLQVALRAMAGRGGSGRKASSILRTQTC